MPAQVQVRAFAGMMPRIEPELLPDTAATLATNARTLSGALQPWNQPQAVLTLPGLQTVRTIYRFGQSAVSDTQFWFQFTDDVDVVKGPIDGDTEERTYWTDGTYPKKTRAAIATSSAPYPSSSLRMGVPSPSFTSPPFQSVTFSPTASVSGTPSDPNSTASDSNYVVTYVSSWGEEGSPSLPTGTVTWRAGQTVSVTLPAAPSGAYDITKVRVYRSNVGTSRAGYQLAGEATVGTSVFLDATPGSQLEEELPTFDWDMPPDSLVGLTHMGNGVLAGFFGNTLCFSEPNIPYAWPVKYRLSTDAPIVGIGAFGQSLFVGTTRGAYVVTGVDPSAMTMDKLTLSQACLSKRSIVPMLGGVVYASPDGLFLASGAGVQNLTEAILTRDEWQAYVPSSISAYEIDGRYYAFYDTGSLQAGLIFTFGESASFVKTDQYVTAGYQEKLSDTLFVVQNGVELKKWGASATPMTATWRSKDFLFPQTTCMACARVFAAAYPVTFKLYADDTLRHTQTVADNRPFRLPSGYRCTRVAFEISTTTTVRRVDIASSMPALGALA